MRHVAILIGLLVVVMSSLLTSAQASDECAPEAPEDWTSLVDDTELLLTESRDQFASGSPASSPGNTSVIRGLALDWIDMNERWRKIEIPAGREIIQFTANRMAGNLSTTFSHMLDGSIDEFQLGKTAEAMDAYAVSTAVFDLLQAGCNR